MVGLLGGLSWHSTIEYYRIINDEIAKRLGNKHSARIILYSFDFNEIHELQSKGDWHTIVDKFVHAGRVLEHAGAEAILICANTMHKVADEVQSKLRVKLLHICDATANAIKSKGLSKVGLLGTKTTMTDPFYKERLERHGIAVIVPSNGDIATVDSIIFDELVKGIISDTARSRVVQIINNLVEEGAEGIILGCTELPLLIQQKHVSVPLFDTLRLHAMSAVEFALA